MEELLAFIQGDEQETQTSSKAAKRQRRKLKKVGGIDHGIVWVWWYVYGGIGHVTAFSITLLVHPLSHTLMPPLIPS